MHRVYLAWTHAIHRITESKALRRSALFFVMLVSVAVYISIYAGNVQAATNSNINFQARVLTDTGAVVGDGFYTVEFNIYSQSSGGTSQWTEAQAVTSKNGYITVSLGSVTPFGSGIDWSQEQWLSMNINGDGEMSPRMKITAVPLAFRANQADSLTTTTGTISANNLAQLAPGSVQSINSVNSALRISQLGGGGLLQLQNNGGDIFTVANNGNTNIGGSLSVNSGITVGNSTSTTAGTIRWTGLVFEGYNGTAWAPLGGGGYSSMATASFVSGLQNVTANQTGLPVEMLVFTSATAVSNTAGVTGFTAPADGSFRTCLVKNNATITAGTLGVRWMVNGASVGSPACNMSSTTNRQSATTLNSGQVTFKAGDTIGIAFDTSSGFLPTGSNDYTVYWTVEYSGSVIGGSGGDTTLQEAYDNSIAATIQTVNNKDIKFNLANTAIDSNFIVDIQTGSTSKFAVQNNGSDIFRVSGLGDAMTGRGITLGNSTSTTAGTIRYTGTDFEGYDGSNWISLTTGGGGGGATLNIANKIKQVNETVNGSATLQDDDELSFAVGPNEAWSYRFVVHASSATTPDLQFAVSAPAGATCRVGYSDPEGATSVGNLGCGVTTGLVAGNGAVDVYEIVGTVQNGATAGNVTLRWAQNTANASNSIVYAGSYMQAIRSVGAGANGNPFAQGGNSFGTTAVLGTNDNHSLSINTNGLTRMTVADNGNIGVGDTTPSALFTVGTNDAMQVDASGNLLTSGSLAVGGLTTLSGSLVASNSATGTTGTTSGSGTNTTTLTLGSDSFNINDVVLIDNTGQDYYTRIVNDPGTGSYTVSPTITFESGRTVTKYTVQNIGATPSDYNSQGNRFFQGYFLGGLVVGAGSTTISDGSIESTTTLRLQENGGSLAIGGALDVAGAITGDGSGLTNIDGTQISSGSIMDSSLSINVTLLGNSFNGANQLLQLNGSSELPGLSGTNLTNLNASNITAGTLGDNRLSSNVGLVNLSQTYSAQQTFAANILLGTDSAMPTPGTLAFNDNVGSNNYTSVLGTSSLTANRSINLPDENGTLCVGSSVNCGYILLAPGSAQSDSSTNNSLFINKTASSGDILNLQKSGTTVLQMLNSGALRLALTDTSAFTVENASGTDLFNIDTSGGLVRIGGASADSTGVLFVLDTKNTSGDPTGTNGGSYYNSNSGKSRCYENGTWMDCITAVNKNKSAVQTVTNSATFTSDSALVYAMAANSSYNISASINYSSTSAAADFKYTFTVPSGATVYLATDATTGNTSNTICNITTSGQTCTVLISGGFRGIIRVTGTVITAATAGDIQFRFAQNSQISGQSVSVYQGSLLQATRTDQ